MKNNIKKVYAQALVFSILFCAFFSVNVQAEQLNEFDISNESIVFEKSKILESVGTISTKKSIIIKEQKNYLFPIFDNEESAIENINVMAKNVLDELSMKNGEEKMTSSNWMKYYSIIDTVEKNENETEWNLLNAFFDIYENNTVNCDILSIVQNNELTNDEIKKELYYMLPYTDPLVVQLSEEMKIGAVAYSNFNVDAAINYANCYANNPNSYEYGELSNDCTNFTSQIMESGGIGQEDDVQYPWVGWWHVRDGNANYYSNSWVRADAFARYFGVSYSSTSHFHFSANIEAGVFILQDTNSDGSWNHSAFVVASDNYLTDGYYDYFVAQHSANYLAWTSSENNHWEQGEEQGCTYGIIYP